MCRPLCIIIILYTVVVVVVAPIWYPQGYSERVMGVPRPPTDALRGG